MLKSKGHVYGGPAVVPSHVHFGQHLLERMMGGADQMAIMVVGPLIDSDTKASLTYTELAQKTVDIALSLSHLGVRKGEVVTACAESRYTMAVIPSILGTICAGAVFTPTDATYGEDPLIHRLNIARPKVMFCSASTLSQQWDLFESVGCIQHYIIYDEDRKQYNLPPSPKILAFKDFLTQSGLVEDFKCTPVEGWRDNLWILFSSGTTGLPKGVPWTHMGMLVTAQSCTDARFEGHGLLITRGWCYTYGLVYIMAGLTARATVVYSGQNSIDDWLLAIQDYKIKFLQMTPSSVLEMVHTHFLNQFDLSSVSGIISSSTTLMEEQIAAVRERLPQLSSIYQIYGSSEAGCICSELVSGPRVGSAGVPSMGYILKVVDLKTGQPLGPGERGEVCIKAPYFTSGYIGVPPEEFLDSEGFYRSGDVGYYDDDDYFYIVGRIKELIKYNDFSVAPAELESILLQHKGVFQVGVVGAPREEGEAPTAFVVLKDPGSVGADELMKFLEDRFTFRIRLTGGVRFIRELPRGAMGKLNRNALKDML